MNDTKNSWENRQTEKQFGDKLNQATDCKNKTEQTADKRLRRVIRRISQAANNVSVAVKYSLERSGHRP